MLRILKYGCDFAHSRFPILAIAASFVSLAGPALAQPPPGLAVRFETVDGVQLHGTYFQATQKAAPTVLLLHNIGSDSRQKEWISLARALQKANFSVLTFDFRGHGKSTNIVNAQQFWNTPENMAALGQFAGMVVIGQKLFPAQYYPVLANDIAAARAYLERNKNDIGACNISNLMLVGAGDGALLGAIWLRGEHHRFRMMPPAMFGFPPMPNNKSEGNDIVGCVWLSLENKLGNRAVNPVSTLKKAAFAEATPMAFVYGQGDNMGESVAKGCEKALKGQGQKFDLTVAKMVKDNVVRKGKDLLQPAIGTEQAIVDYLRMVVKTRAKGWQRRDYVRAEHVWRLPPAQFVPSKLPNTDVPLFDTYDKFIR